MTEYLTAHLWHLIRIVLGWVGLALRIDRDHLQVALATAHTELDILRENRTPTPDQLWEAVRTSEQGAKARMLGRQYGRASQTIGQQRLLIEQLRADLESVRASAVGWQSVAEMRRSRLVAVPTAADGPPVWTVGHEIRGRDARVDLPNGTVLQAAGPGGSERVLVPADVDPRRAVTGHASYRIVALPPGINAVIRTATSRVVHHDLCQGGDCGCSGLTADELARIQVDPADTAKVGDHLGRDWLEGQGPHCYEYDHGHGCTRAAGHGGRQHVSTIDGQVWRVWPTSQAERDAAVLATAEQAGNDLDDELAVGEEVPVQTGPTERTGTVITNHGGDLVIEVPDEPVAGEQR